MTPADRQRLLNLLCAGLKPPAFPLDTRGGIITAAIPARIIPLDSARKKRRRGRKPCPHTPLLPGLVIPLHKDKP